MIDEVQRAPDLMLAVKQILDQDQRPGQFLLTGSADLLTARVIADALPGRVEYAISVRSPRPRSPATIGR